MATPLGTVYANIELRMEQLRTGVARAKTELDSLAKKSEQVEKTFKDMGRSLSFSVTAPLIAIGTVSVQTAARMDSLKRGLTAMTGSVSETERQLKRLREVAKLPGLGMEEAIRGSTRLQATGLSANMAERALKSFGNALATVGGGKAELDGVILALGQIQAKGKVSAEEINQLAERIPQVRKAMEAAFGTANTELLQKAGISAETFITKLIQQFEKLAPVTGGVQNDFENFSDIFKELQNAIGQALLPTLTRWMEALIPKIQAATDWFSKLSPELKELLTISAAAAITGGPLLIFLGSIAGALNNIRSILTAIGGLAAARLLGIGGAIVGLGALSPESLNVRGRGSQGTYQYTPGSQWPTFVPGDISASHTNELADRAAREGMAGGRIATAERFREMAANAARARNIPTLTLPGKTAKGKTARELQIERLQWEAQLTDDPIRKAELERQINLLQKMPIGFADRFFARELNPASRPRIGIGSPRSSIADAVRRMNQSVQGLGDRGIMGPFAAPGAGARVFGAEQQKIAGEAGATAAIQDMAAALKGPKFRQEMRKVGELGGEEIGQGLRDAVAEIRNIDAVRKKFRAAFSFLGDLGAEVGAEFYYGMRDSLQRLFGGGTIGRILSNSISRSLSRTFDTLIDTAITGLSKNAMRGAGGKGITGGEHRFTWQSLGGLALGAAASAGIGAVIGGLFKGAGIGKLLGGLFRAGGGSVSSGRGYIVGERGPELFVPKTGGMIVPNHALAGAGGIVINMGGAYHIREEADIGRLAREVAIRVERGSRARPGS